MSCTICTAVLSAIYHARRPSCQSYHSRTLYQPPSAVIHAALVSKIACCHSIMPSADRPNLIARRHKARHFKLYCLEVWHS